MKKVALLFVYGIIFLIIARPSSASVLFEDNFDSYPSGSFPTKWENYESNCSANFYVHDGMLKLAIAQHPCSENIVPSEIYWQNLDNYIFEFDILFKSGVDRHAYYRLNKDLGFVRLVHFTYPAGYSIFNGIGSTGYYRGYVPNVRYHYKIITTSTNIKIYESSELNPIPSLISEVNQNMTMPVGFIGFGSSPGSGILTETWFDNVRATTIDHEDNQGHDVPLLKQYDLPWGDDIYDSAEKWSDNGLTMSEWGCAVTSAAMVFQYHGLEEMEDNTSLDPGSLNEWLKGQADGYIRNGLVNWIALSRLSKNISLPNGVAFDALEFSRKSVDDTLLTSSLVDMENPVILEEPGHFIVATGIDEDNSSYLVNDPYYSIDTLSDPQYSNSYLGMRTYTPVNSDLSYIMLVVDNDSEIEFFNDLGQPVGELVVEDPISDTQGASTNTSGSLKVVYYPKPNSGVYTIKISSSAGNYTLDQYLYDENGVVKMKSFSESIFDDQTDIYLISFNKENASGSSSSKVVTYEYLRDEIINGYEQHKMDFGMHVSLLALLNNAEKAKKAEISQKMLEQMIHLISKGGKIALDFAGELVADINILNNSL